MELYDYPDVYDERWTEAANKVYRDHYQKIFAGCDITDILDCSIGTGALTFCLCELGYQVSGSDLSASMLSKAEEKAVQKGLSVPFVRCDFRELTSICIRSPSGTLSRYWKDSTLKSLQLSRFPILRINLLRKWTGTVCWQGSWDEPNIRMACSCKSGL